VQGVRNGLKSNYVIRIERINPHRWRNDLFIIDPGRDGNGIAGAASQAAMR